MDSSLALVNKLELLIMISNYLINWINKNWTQGCVAFQLYSPPFFFGLVPTKKCDLLLEWIEFTLSLTNSGFWCRGMGRCVWIIEEFSFIGFFQSRILTLSSGLYNITRIKTLFEAMSFVLFPAIIPVSGI